MSTKDKHVPQRTCIACRESRPKGDLIRVVRTNEGEVEVDLSSKRPGRGAYLCPKKDCWAVGLKGNHLEHVLRTKLSSDNRQALMDYGKNLL